MINISINQNVFIEVATKITSKQAVIGIVGLGYVGLPIASAFAKKGFKVIGFDINDVRVQAINNGYSHIKAVSSDDLKSFIKAELFRASSDFSSIAECDAIIICVPTPIDSYSNPDLTYMTESADTIVKYLRKGQVVSLESTTYPGTTEEIILPILARSGLVVGKDFFLLYSPEREDPGNFHYGMSSIPKVVSGHSVNCLKIGSLLYGAVVDKVVEVSSTKVAEMTKLLENIYRCVNISMINEIKVIADSMNINILEVIDAAATKPFGFTPFYPGPGIGGHCIPVDPFYLTYKAKEFGIHTRFIELAGEINYKVQDFVVNKLMLALNDIGKSLKNSKILVLGIAYKKNVEDMRESPSVRILKKLINKGAIVDYHDDLVQDMYLNVNKNEAKILIKSIKISADTVANYDVVLLLTDHDSVDYDMILKNAKLIVDTRGRYKEDLKKHNRKVILA
jgi:UDP-N-acetyl-D-glucosamine dehydrogenase